MKRKLIICAVSSFILISCASKKENIVYSGNVYEQAMQAYKSGDYKTAKDKLRKTIFSAEGVTPQQIMEARFALADSYYQREEYVDAIVEFEEFISLYPTSPKVPEALFKLSLSYLSVAPDYKRDITYINKAEEKAQEILDSYPDSEFVNGAKKVIAKARELKAKHLIYIADSYEKYGKFYSASLYYSDVYEKYKDYIEKDYIAYKLAYNLINAKKQYEDEIKKYTEYLQDTEKAIEKEQDLEAKNAMINRKKVIEDHLALLNERIEKSKERAIDILKLFSKAFPDSKYKKDAENLLSKVEK